MTTDTRVRTPLSASSSPGRQIIYFLLAGGMAAAANFFSRIAFSILVPFEIAIVMAFCVGLATGFLLMRTFVFEPSRLPWPRQLRNYLLVNLLALAQTVVISVLLDRAVLPWLGVDAFRQEIAHFFGITVPLVTSFLGHKHFSFRSANGADQKR